MKAKEIIVDGWPSEYFSQNLLNPVISFRGAKNSYFKPTVNATWLDCSAKPPFGKP